MRIVAIVSVLLASSPATATPLSDLAATVEPGTFVELPIDGTVTNCDAFIPPSGNGNILEFMDEAQWDPISREIYIMGTARPYAYEDQQFIKYTEATNAWTILEHPPFNPGFHGYDHAAFDPITGDYYWVQTGATRFVWILEHGGDWIQIADIPTGSTPQTVAIEYFPEMGGAVYFNPFNNGEYFLYDRDGDTWARTALDVPIGELSMFSEYSLRHQMLFFGGGYNWEDTTPEIDESRRLYALDDSGTMTRLADSPIYMGQSGGGPVQTIDPVTGNLLVFPGDVGNDTCPDPNPFYEYNVLTNTWREAGTHQLMNFYCGGYTAATPLYDYGVIFLATYYGADNCIVQLYRHTEPDLVAPGPPENLVAH